MSEVIIKTRENGPLLVTGPATLIDHLGNRYDTSARENIALCRCGGSISKPFCDGTHSRIGFQAAEAAVRAEEQQTPKPVDNNPQPKGS